MNNTNKPQDSRLYVLSKFIVTFNRHLRNVHSIFIGSFRLIGLSRVHSTCQLSSQSLEDPANPDGVQTGANPVGRRCCSLEPVDDTVQSEVESSQTEDARPDAHLTPAEVVHVDRMTGDFYVQVGFNNILTVDEIMATTLRSVEGV